MEKLTEQLDILINRFANSNSFRKELENLHSVYPFSKFEYIIAALFANGKISFDEYLEIRDDYINRNLFLYIYEITAPRGFGDTWAFGHLLSVEPELKRPNKRIDSAYKGEYDLLLPYDSHNIKIEVKASRANDREKNDEPLYIKALSSYGQRPFLMNFQQLKPSCCDVFLWIAVYRDAIKYWVMNSDTVQNHPDFTPQHRNEETANRRNDYSKSDIYEGQIMMTEKNIRNFDKYLISGKDLKEAIIKQYKKQLRQQK